MNAACNIKPYLEAAPHKAASWKLSKLDESDMCDTAGEVGMNS